MTTHQLTDQQLDLDAIEARANAATPGPWFIHEDWPGRVFAESEFNIHIARVTGSNPEPNEQFIAHARADVDALLAEVRRLRAELADQVRYAAALEAGLCTCEPLCENGEYLHAADCPVVDIQMQTYGGPEAEEAHVVADDSDDPEHVDDCPGCLAAAARPSV